MRSLRGHPTNGMKHCANGWLDESTEDRTKGHRISLPSLTKQRRWMSTPSQEVLRNDAVNGDISSDAKSTSMHLAYVDPFRIIPAGAGSTPACSPPPHRSWDHPRRCGEHDLLYVAMSPVLGSSPQVRGAPATGGTTDACTGIIPAGAGSTTGCGVDQISSWDHPRRCGEHMIHFGQVDSLKGSSPQVRGALALDELNPDVVGDHPRRCGEHEIARTALADSGGSSPQVRGAPARSSGREERGRIIPAGAGSTGACCRRR